MAETDPVTYFKSEIKRLNYYNSQFLVETDFNDEQRYHKQMRRLHNRALHTWGVVEGLAVERVPNEVKVTVAPGIAIDRLGQEIVLPERSAALGFDKYDAGAQVYVTIKYMDVTDQADRDKNDAQTEGGRYRRWTERPKVDTSATEPTADAPDMVLAVVTLDKDKAIAEVSQSKRRYAGSRIGASDTGKEFAVYADTDGAWHFFDGARGADRLTVDANGNVGIGVPAPTQRLEVAGSIMMSTAPGGVSALMSNGGLLLAGGKTLLGLRESGVVVSKSWGGNGNLSVQGDLSVNGNVGIGTPTPGFPLSFPNESGDKIALWGQSGNHYGFGIQGALLQIHTDTSDADIAFGHGSSAPFTELMRIKGTGNVGIGTDNPRGKLDVRGHLVLEAGGSPILYTGTGGADLNRYVQLLNSPDNGVASGLKTGSLLVSDDYGYASPSRNDLIVKGRVGVGTAAPVSRLHVHGDYTNDGTGGITLDASDNADPETYVLRINPFSPGNGKVGYQFQTKSHLGGTNVPLTFDNAGNVSIGTAAAPSVRLDVAEGGVYVRHPTGGGNTAKALEVGSQDTVTAGVPNGRIGFPGNGVQHGQLRWVPAAASAGRFELINSSAHSPSGDYGANPSYVNLHAGSAAFIGNVGVQATSPAAKLSVGGNGRDVYATDVWVERNMHVQGNEELFNNGGRGSLRVGTCAHFIGLYAERSSTGLVSDLFLGASSNIVRVGTNDSPHLLVIADEYVPTGPTNYRILCGTISKEGKVLTGAGIRVTARATGLYTITFLPAFKSRPSASVTQIYPSADDFGGGGDTRDNAVIVGLNTTTIKIKTGGSGGGAEDRAFSFIVVGSK